MAYGGRVAEELVFGSEKVTTGAAQDIQQATDIARRMVTQYGMSDTIGPIAVGDREAEIFLGREVVQRREISERTAELVDTEVKRILNDAFERDRAPRRARPPGGGAARARDARPRRRGACGRGEAAAAVAAPAAGARHTLGRRRAA
jgi:Peptidase family M41